MRLTNRSVGGKRIIVGLNSGTSADGVDLSALSITRHKNKPTIVFLRGRSNRYPEDIRSAILEAIETKSITPERLIALDNIVGQFFGTCAHKFIRDLSKKGIHVDALGSHGQTIRHLPVAENIGKRSAKGSLQIASPEQIASITGLPVVSDFRQADIALGGEGAPITVSAMHQLFSSVREPRLIVNIGGIANYFYFPKGSKIIESRAADCGPGNSLIDSLAQSLFDLPFDRSGNLASGGAISQKLLKQMQRAPFFTRKPSDNRISTGKEEFGPMFARRILKAGNKTRVSPHDLLATVTELTVWGITRMFNEIDVDSGHLKKLYLTGGGSRNKLIVRRLKQELPSITVCSIDELGIPASLVESASFAVMADATLRGIAMPTQFGVKKEQKIMPVSGRICLPPQKESTARRHQWRYFA